MTPTCTIHVGDCLELMPTFEAESFDSVITDPPYELGFMGKKWDRSGVSFNVGTWAECFRLLKPGGHLLAFSSTRTAHRIACAIEDAGFEIRDTIAWIYGSGFPKSKNLTGKWKGWGTALKPAMEPIIVARKPFRGTTAENVAQHGVGALNIDGCRVPLPIDDPLQGGVIHSGKALDTGATEGQWGFKAVDREAGLGRWPANIIHDGSEEVVQIFPEKAGAAAPVKGSEPMANGFSGPVKFSGMKKRVDSTATYRGDKGGAARFFYCAKASRADRNFGTEALPELPILWSNGTKNPGSFQAAGTNRAATNSHPTVKPTELMRYLCRLVTPPDGLILDPFAGSGSTGKAAILEGFRSVLLELNPSYAEIARRRTNVTPGLALS